MRRAAIVLLLLCVGLVTVGVAVSATDHRAPGASRAAGAVPAASRCGLEAWAVKTLSDPGAVEVDYVPLRTNVTWLAALRPPGNLGTRLPGAEMHTWRVSVRLLWQKLEADSDVHLVVADLRTGRTMIAELPAPACVGAAVVPRAAMAAARASLAGYCGRPERRFTALHGTATMDGVAFFDFPHGQRGRAPNLVELHPVLRFSPGPGRC
jgi:hypothetical protein